MSQYRTGTVAINIATPTIVTGTGTLWNMLDTPVTPLTTFKLFGLPTVYPVASIDYTAQTITLVAPGYIGATVTAQQYQIQKDFTIRNYPELSSGDVDFATYITRALRAISTDIATMMDYGLKPIGTWNAATNTPVLPPAAPENIGWLYKVAVAGTFGGTVYGVDDSVISNGTVWFHAPSVAGSVSVDAVNAASAAASALISQNATAADVLLTAADRIQTGLDVVASGSSATSAAGSASSLAAALISFRSTFLGHLAADPLVDGNGDALMDGVTYVNTISDKIRVYDTGTGTWSDYDAAAQSATTSANLSALSAAASESSALSSKNAADADVIATAADRVQTGLDVISAAASASTATEQAGVSTAKASEANQSAIDAAASAVEAAGFLGGSVIGPDVAVDSSFAVFDGTTGLLIKDSGKKAADFATALGSDDNYVTDAEKTALHGHSNKVALDAVSGTNTGDQDLSGKQDVLVSGTNIKTINGIAIPGSGDIVIASGTGVTVSGTLTLYVTQSTTLAVTNYDSATVYAVTATAGTATITGDTITYTAGSVDGSVTLTITAGASTRDITITVNAAGISTPTNTSPATGATDQSGPTLTLTSSAFAWVGLTDTHASSDWEMATDSGFATIVDSSYADTTNKTAWTADVAVSSTYYWRVRYNGASGRVSAWSAPTVFSTKSSFGGLIGVAGAQGFGVGVYNGTLPMGFTAMTGTTDPASDNYGNYQYSDGSVMCFTPKFYYRIGSTSSPRYAVYGLNAIDVVGVSTFADEAAANAAGYALHRAFIDGGSVKSGFFIDKYLCSKNGTTSGKSVKNGDPISLTSATYNPSSTMTGCTGILADAVVLSRARGAGTFNVASIFMYSALALLSLAHGQAATATTYCAWYDATLTTNFPKGCNNGALADVNDLSVTFTVSGISPKPLTGSASNLAKTSHNGQNCGVIDLNGAMYQALLGLTDFGTSAIDTAAHTNGNVYLLKTTVALASLTAGWDGSTDAWGNSTHLALLYDAVTGLLPWGATAGWLYMGNGANQVLDEVTSGIGYQRTSCGIPQDTSALSAAGTNGFGNDGQYQSNKANLFPLASGYWSYAADAGVFYRYWSRSRSSDYYSSGFRASAYGL
jgi:hypothetical protein